MQYFADCLFDWLLKTKVINEAQFKELHILLTEEVKKEFQSIEKEKKRPWWQKIL